MPDGLSKTVPIWCCVVNRALKLRRDHKADTKTAESDEWDTTLYLPAIVSPSERSQIESRLDGWAASLEVGNSTLPLHC
jgi:tRNA A64-2'-O-ribosylphosphate transferase